MRRVGYGHSVAIFLNHGLDSHHRDHLFRLRYSRLLDKLGELDLAWRKDTLAAENLSFFHFNAIQVAIIIVVLNDQLLTYLQDRDLTLLLIFCGNGRVAEDYPWM